MIERTRRVVFGGMSRLTGVVAAAFGLATALPAATAQEPISPEAAPPTWVAFGEAANSRVTEWLRAEDEVAMRLRLHVDGLRSAPDQPSLPILLKLWLIPPA